MAIVNRVRECRFFADEMTQQALAEAVGVTRQTIMAIEKNKYNPSLEVAFKIAHLFNKPLEEVFAYEAEEQ
jgi:putative transcriptional regulator